MSSWARRLLGAVALALLTMGPVAADEVRKQSNLDYAIELYEESKTVEPALNSAKELADIIDQRIVCYQQWGKPRDRLGVCHKQYLKRIVSVARKNVHSMPELGLFLRAVQGCPMVYSLCMGEIGDPALCRVRERQCIDLQLDKHWRGAALPAPREQ